MLSSEKIMVCVYHGPNGERLIRRGSRLAGLCQCPLFVLSVLPEQENDQVGQEISENIRHWKTISEQCRATFMTKTSGNRKVADVIAHTARQLQITQLIIGHPGMSRWQEIWHGSIVNELLKKIEEVDIHIIAIQEDQDKRALEPML